MRLFLKSPCATNSNLIMAVGTAASATRSSTAELITDGFKLNYDNLTLTLNWNSSNTSSTSPPAITFTRSDGSTLFSYDVSIDRDKYFRMYNGAQSLGPNYTSFEINGSNGATRIGKNTPTNGTAGSLVLGSHLILNADSVAPAPTSANRPTGTKGLLRFNNDNNSAEIYDGSYWVDVGYYSGLPLGAIIAYPSATVPSGSFKLCDGQEISRETYADLYNLFTIAPNTIYTYGAGNGLTTFNVPNIKGKTIVGYDIGDAEFKPIGKTGGEKAHKLIIDEIPGHTHPIEATALSGSITSTFTGSASDTAQDTHNHGTGSFVTGVTELHANDYVEQVVAQAQYASPVSSIQTSVGTVPNNTHSHEFTATGAVTNTHTLKTNATSTQTIGGGLAHNNLQPYIVLNYFIKVLKEPKRYNSTLASDIRVKRNIVPLNSEQAIEAIRMMQPKKYEYIDRNMSEFSQHIGFIAQEARLCIPESVCTKKEYIPNIYSMAKLTSMNPLSSGPPSNSVLTSVQYPILDLIKEQQQLQFPDTSRTNLNIKGVKLKMFNKSKECFYVCCVEPIDDYNILVEPLDAVTTARILSADYFVYGQEIEDYHYMNNDAVFSTMVSAFQALDKICKHQQLLIATLIEKNNLKL